MMQSPGNALSALRQYAQVGVETGVQDASPHRLIEMLLDGALSKIAAAGGHLKRGETAQKGANISWAISIIGGLKGSLDMQAGGTLAANLEALYDYAGRRLLEANVRNDDKALAEVYGLLSEIRSAWGAIRDQVSERAVESSGA